MAITVTHAYVSEIPEDGSSGIPDGLVGPTEWNADHVVEGMTGLPMATSNMTWYVSTTGSDSNDGLTSGTAFATISHAVNIAAGYDYQGIYFPTINVADGTYGSSDFNCSLPQLCRPGGTNGVYGGLIQGNTTTPDNCVLSGGGGNDIFDVFQSESGVASSTGRVTISALPNSWLVQGFQFTGSVGNAFFIGQYCNCQCNLIDFACQDAAGLLGFFDSSYSGFNFGSTGGGAANITISTTSSNGFIVAGNFSLFCSVFGDGMTITFQNSPSFGAFIDIDAYFGVFMDNITLVNANTVTGPRVAADAYSVIAWSTNLGNDRSTVPGNSTFQIIGGGDPNNNFIFRGDTFYGEVTPTTGTTVTMSPGQKNLLLIPAGGLAALTVDLPILMSDGEHVRISSTQAITTLTIATTDGSSVVASPTTLAAGGAFGMFYDGQNNRWLPY